MEIHFGNLTIGNYNNRAKDTNTYSSYVNNVERMVHNLNGSFARSVIEWNHEYNKYTIFLFLTLVKQKGHTNLNTLKH